MRIFPESGIRLFLKQISIIRTNFRISLYLCTRILRKNIIMATAIRAIPTLYGETAKSFESEAERTEQNPGTQDYRHEAKVVSDFLKTCTVL